MVYRESLKLQSRDRAVSFHDVTQQVKEIAAKSGMKNGICVVYSHHNIPSRFSRYVTSVDWLAASLRYISYDDELARGLSSLKPSASSG